MKMSMRLMPATLEQIARDLDKIKDLGIQVESFKSAGHKILLRWEGPDEPVVIGITQGEFSGPNFRGDGGSMGDGGRAEAVERTSGSATLPIGVARGVR